MASDLHVRVRGSDVEAQVNGRWGAEGGDGAGVGSVSGSLEEAVLEDHDRTRDGQMEERAERHQPVHRAPQADRVVPQVGSKVLQNSWIKDANFRMCLVTRREPLPPFDQT